MEGNYSYLTKKQISVDNFNGISITTYGYPYVDATYIYPMFSIKGKTTSRPSNEEQVTYRVLYASGSAGDDASNFSGMSGGPVLDANGNVITINIGRTNYTNPKLSMAVSLDKWLYAKLKNYE